ncbi:MAG TPA: NAD-dependent epimerase/dehydratase family protein [Ktedonobacteraceae bacterium]
MEILITGGNGFLGRNLILALQERGDTARVLALPAENTAWLEERGVQVFRGDLRDPQVLQAPMQGVDKVVHLAAMMGSWRSTSEYAAVNVTGTENVCRAALANGVRRLVHTSSAMVYNLACGHPVTENDPLNPLTEPYSTTKAEGDRLVQRMIAQDHLPAVIIRPGTIFGPGDNLNFGRIAERVRAHKAIMIGSGKNAVPFVYVTDVVLGLLLALDHEKALGQAYNIANDQPLTQQELLSSIAKEVGGEPPHIYAPYWPLYTAAYSAERLSNLSKFRIAPFVTRHGVKLYGADNRISIDKARRELGYVPQVSLSEGIRLTAAWYRNRDVPAQEQQTASAPAAVKVN